MTTSLLSSSDTDDSEGHGSLSKRSGWVQVHAARAKSFTEAITFHTGEGRGRMPFHVLKLGRMQSETCLLLSLFSSVALWACVLGAGGQFVRAATPSFRA